MLATRKLRLKFIFILRHYAAEWMSALRNGMRNNCLFGTYRASSTRNYSSPMSSEYPATIRIDNDAGRIAFLSSRGSRFERVDEFELGGAPRGVDVMSTNSDGPVPSTLFADENLPRSKV